MCGGIFSDYFAANFLESMPVHEVLKSSSTFDDIMTSWSILCVIIFVAS